MSWRHVGIVPPALEVELLGRLGCT